jgi:4-aminobutyrate aminotransferase-like enzyme
MREAMGNAFVPGAVALDPAEAAMIERRGRVLGPAYRLQYERPLHIVRGEGVHLTDANGVRYLDAYNNVPSVGHAHPRVVEALTRQAATLNTHTRYLHENILAYAERLLATMPDALAHVMFTCTGSEANDLAGRIAQAHTGGTGFIVTRYAYHGVTEVVSRLSPCLGEGVQQGPHVRLVAPPESGVADVGARFAEGVRRAIADLEAHGIRPAALLVDTVFTSDGNYVDPAGFLGPAVEAIREAGGLFIADEVQPGFGRTGAHFWGFGRHGIVPDMITMGKPMGNGHPMGAVAGRREPIASFANQVRYFNTFGGNPVSCAVGLAVLDVITDEGLMANAADVGAHLHAGLDALSGRCPTLGERRVAGLACAVDVVDAEGRPDPVAATRIVNGLRDRQVLISISGIEHATLKIRPPLVFQRAHADQLLEALEGVLRA